MKIYIFLMVALLIAVGTKAQTEIDGLWYNLHDWDNTASVYMDNYTITFEGDEISIP